jgi:CubicO group peptidase (beta-lactamase class C family)
MANKRNLTLAGAALLVIVLLALHLYSRVSVPVGSGYTAKNLCSWVFVGGADPDRALHDFIAPAVSPLLPFVSVDLDPKKKTVTVSSLLYGTRKAVFRDRLGCTLLSGITETELRAQPFKPLPRPELDPKIPWPFGSAGPLSRSQAEMKGIDIAKIDGVIDELMREPADGTPRQTNAIAVVWHGRLVAERYADGFGPESPFISWSMAKSVTNTLVGIGVREGLIDVDERAPVPAWADASDPRHAITTDHLLRMSAGLEFEEVYGSLSQVSHMLHNERDMAGYAASLPMEARPDEKWNYSTGTTIILCRILFDLTGGTLNDFHAFAEGELFQKLGIRTAVFEPDPTGVLVGGSYVHMSARDFARLGLLWIGDGIWNGKRILPEGWMRYSLTPTPPAPLRQYGAQFWLNLGDPKNPKDRKWPRLPTSAFAAVGHHGQYIMMVPDKKVIVVRLGVTFDGSDAGRELRHDDIQKLTATVLDSVPVSPPPTPKREPPRPPPVPPTHPPLPPGEPPGE